MNSPPTTPPSTHGVDANRAAENAIRVDRAADERRRSQVDETTDEAEAPIVPDRVGRVSIEEVQMKEDGSVEPLADDESAGDEDPR